MNLIKDFVSGKVSSTRYQSGGKLKNNQVIDRVRLANILKDDLEKRQKRDEGLAMQMKEELGMKLKGMFKDHRADTVEQKQRY